ncbi:hypothetical protein SAMN05660691_04044 [Rheinheimera pacifica]|uniref:Uncharacterized protein n=1 Tax=Rheinheimera pacifica TaxID=173990 RepID=A0A1H6NDB6_9GAMM|nr:hypothetical protein SAMN05660691_04044 [Rheinheimera pacifica]
MDNQRVTEQQAVAMLQVWNSLGRDLAALARLHPDNSKKLIVLMLPGYRCNQWYQVGDGYSCYTEALTSLGCLIDKTRVSA